MGGKRVLLDGAAARDHDLLGIAAGRAPPPGRAPRHDGLDLLRFLHDLLGHCALDAVTRDDDAVLLARRPPLEQLAAHAVLQHTRAGKHDAAPDVLETVDGLERADELKVPRPALARGVASGFRLGHALPEESLDVVVHGADVCLIDQHAFPSEVAGIVDGVFLVLPVLPPVLVENEQQLLRTAEGKDGHQHPAAAVQHAGDRLHQRLLPLYPWYVRGDAVG